MFGNEADERAAEVALDSNGIVEVPYTVNGIGGLSKRPSQLWPFSFFKIDAFPKPPFGVSQGMSYLGNTRRGILQI